MGTGCSQLVKHATNAWSPTIDQEAVKDVIQYIRNHPNSSKRCLSSMTKRLLHKDKNPLVVDKALYLLDACAINCGYWFRELVASKAVLIPLENLIFNGNPSNSKNAIRMVDRWSRTTFANDSGLKPVVDFDNYLKRTVDPRIYVPATPTAPTGGASTARNARIRITPTEVREKFDIDRAIALSLAEHETARAKREAEEEAFRVGYPTPPPQPPSSCSNSNGRKVVALFDFNALTDNGELSYPVFAGEVLELEDETDPNWWKGCKGGKMGNFPSRFVSKDVTLMFAMKTEGNNLYTKSDLAKTQESNVSAPPAGQSTFYNQQQEANNRNVLLASPPQLNGVSASPVVEAGPYQPREAPTAPGTKIGVPNEHHQTGVPEMQSGTPLPNQEHGQTPNIPTGFPALQSGPPLPYQESGHIPNIYPQLPTDIDNQEITQKQEDVDGEIEKQPVKKKNKKKKKKQPPAMLN